MKDFNEETKKKGIKHVMEILPRFRRIIEKIESIKGDIVEQSKIDYKSQDARMVALDSIQMEISQVGMWIIAFNSLANKCMKSPVEIDETDFLKSVGSNLSIKDTEIYMMKTLRLCLITLVHFKIDNLFQNILKKLDAKLGKIGYWNLCGVILKEASLSENGKEKEILTVLAYIRNSLHNNGIHRNNSLKLRLNDFAFDFIKDKKVKCASWDHIIIALDKNIDVLGNILLSKKIKGIKTEIKDDFASTIDRN